jgi:hypothetical protein
MNQRIEILFDAFSNAPPNQCFPSYENAFMLQPSDGPLTRYPKYIPTGAND